MYVFYLDDSDEGSLHTFCALGVPSDEWRGTFDTVKAWRQELKQSDGILLRKEFHATDFVAGRGRLTSDGFVAKRRRCTIFRESMQMLAAMQHLLLFSVAMNQQDWAYERLLNRINRTMQAKNTHALLISDQGKEAEYTKLVRRMAVHNPIPSKYGAWGGGSATKNIPTERIIEDPIFRPSERSYLLQMADFCAFALLRYLVGVPRHKEQYGIHTAFELLEPICFKAANPKHPLGVIG